jgi:hypothetical protein
MSINPYESPASEPVVTGVNSGTREDLRAVARYQKGILICILIYLLVVVGQFLIPQQFRIFLGLGVVVLGLVGMAFTFLLASKVYSMVIGILVAILTLIPCIGLIALLIVNAKATSVLTQNGIKVGLMGADLSQV